MKNVTFAGIALLVMACNTSSEAPKDAPKGEPKKEQAGGDTKPAAETKPEVKTTKIEQVGLTAELPADATVSKGISDNSAMVSTTACTLTISVAKDTDPKTVEQGKSSAMLGDKGRGLKGDKTADGSNLKPPAGGDDWLLILVKTGPGG